MKAAALHQNGNAFERSRHQLTLVANDAGLREAGNFGVGDAHRVLHVLGEEAQAGSQDDRHAGTALTQTPGHGVRGGTDLRFPGRGRFRHNNIPANVADKKFASVPAIIARRSEEHTSELQSLAYLVCRLLLEKKKKIIFLSSYLKKKNNHK